MGHTMRTETLRYTEWRGSSAVDVELYDVGNDPHETVNVAGDPSFATRLRQMRNLMRDGWKGARHAIR
jgi:arylsulfatase A-like enzyme